MQPTHRCGRGQETYAHNWRIWPPTGPADQPGGHRTESALGVALPDCSRSPCVMGPGFGLGARSRRSARSLAESLLESTLCIKIDRWRLCQVP
jgi:hypothetical protein